MHIMYFCAHRNTNACLLRVGLFSKQNDRANDMLGEQTWIILEFQLELILTNLHR